jgi:membrane protein
MFGSEKIDRILAFLKKDIWRIRVRDLSTLEWYLIVPLRVILLTIRGLSEGKAHLRASSLTFYSLLSVVPVLAMVFGIAKGFGFQKNLEKLLLENLQGQEEIAQRIIHFAQATLENVKGGLVAGIGIIILFWAIVMILSHIESALNDVWGVKKARPIVRKISDYLSLMLICPVLFFMSSALTVVITSSARMMVERISLLKAVSPAIFFSLGLTRFLTIWILFTFLYIFLPNTKVRFKAGLIGGVLAGTLFILFQWLYIVLQVGVARYNAIYGSFAALPLFFIWLRYSWLIVLFGAEVSFATQNVNTFEFEKDCLTASYAFKRLLSLRMVHLMVKRFSNGEEPLDADQIAQRLDTPIRLVHELLYKLGECGLISETVRSEDGTLAYQPGHDPDILTIQSVIETLERWGSDKIPLQTSESLGKISESLEAFNDLLKNSPKNLRLKEI